MNLAKVKHRILSINGDQYHALEWGKNSFKSSNIKDLILNCLRENEVLYYHVSSNVVYTNDNGFFHVQMELINHIELV